MNYSKVVQWILVILILSDAANAIEFTEESEEERLLKKLLDGYNPLIRPVNVSGPTEVQLDMTLTQIISVNEKDEQLTTSAYMGHYWYDPLLQWNISDYGGINITRIPVDSIWSPRVILDNSKDVEDCGFDVALRVRTLVYPNGNVEWLPPALYKSFCRIEVELFPFDWQNCTMVFRVIGYGIDDIDLTPMYDSIIVDDDAFQANGEWDLINKPVKGGISVTGGEYYKEVRFYLIIKRRPQFYYMNLIVPCMLMTIFSCFTFFLPSISGEKMTLSVSVLLGETVFLFLIAQRMPETSLSIPLLAVYLVFTMGLIILCVVFSVIVCNIHFRSSKTHKIPKWIKSIIIGQMGPFLRVVRPPQSSPWLQARERRRKSYTAEKEKMIRERYPWRAPSELLFDNQAKRYGFRERHVQDRMGFTEVVSAQNGAVRPEEIPTSILPIPKRLQPAIDGINFIAEHIKEEEINAQSVDDWAYVAMILDRLFFWVYLLACILGTIGFFLKIASAKYPVPDE